MGRHDHVRQAVEGRVGLERLLAERVEDRAADRPLAQGAQEGPLHDEPAAGDVDQPGAPLHQGQRPRSSTRSSVSGVSGQGEDHEVGRAEDVAERSGPPAPRPAEAAPRRGRGPPDRRVARILGPNGAASSAIARPMLPKPTIPSVVSRSSRPSRGCHVRSRGSSRSWGRRRFTARHHHQDVLGDRPAEDAARVRDGEPAARPAGVMRRSTPAAAEWTQRRSGRPGQESLEGVRGEPAVQQHLDVVDRAVRQALARHGHDPRPGRGRADGREVLGAIAGREHRREGDRGRGTPPGPSPGPVTPAPPAGRPAPVPMTRRTQRSGRSSSPSRGSVSGPPRGGAGRRGPRRDPRPRRNARRGRTAPS